MLTRKQEITLFVAMYAVAIIVGVSLAYAEVVWKL